VSRHEIRLGPTVTVATGWDRALGFWCEVPGNPTGTYDSTTTSDGMTSIAGVLYTLIKVGVIAREDVADAEMWLAEGDVEDIPEAEVGLRVASEVIAHLREAAR